MHEGRKSKYNSLLVFNNSASFQILTPVSEQANDGSRSMSNSTNFSNRNSVSTVDNFLVDSFLGRHSPVGCLELDRRRSRYDPYSSSQRKLTTTGTATNTSTPISNTNFSPRSIDSFYYTRQHTSTVSTTGCSNNNIRNQNNRYSLDSFHSNDDIKSRFISNDEPLVAGNVNEATSDYLSSSVVPAAAIILVLIASTAIDVSTDDEHNDEDICDDASSSGIEASFAKGNFGNIVSL